MRLTCLTMKAKLRRRSCRIEHDGDDNEGDTEAAAIFCDDQPGERRRPKKLARVQAGAAAFALRGNHQRCTYVKV